MKSTPSLLRLCEHEALSRLTLSGTVLDLGGEKKGHYLSHIKGSFSVVTVNLDTEATPDIFHDLEQPLPIPDASYDHVILINVLEHIFDHRQLLTEAVRVLKPGGTVVVIVPYLFPIHPCPNDYWRFSHQTLEKEFSLQKLSDISLHPLGSGVFAVRHLMLDRLLPTPLRVVNHYTGRYMVQFFDYAWQRLAKILRKKYQPEYYPLGYMATGIK